MHLVMFLHSSKMKATKLQERTGSFRWNHAATTADAGKRFAKTTYQLKGDVPLVLFGYEVQEIIVLIFAISNEYLVS